MNINSFLQIKRILEENGVTGEPQAIIADFFADFADDYARRGVFGEQIREEETKIIDQLEEYLKAYLPHPVDLLLHAPDKKIAKKQLYMAEFLLDQIRAFKAKYIAGQIRKGGDNKLK